MTILWSNNASTTVSGTITAASTSVQLAAGTGAKFPNPTGGDYFVATFYDQATKTINEIVHVTAMAGDVATIVRAQESTVASAWNAGDIFANLVTAGTLRAFVQAGTGPANTSIVYVGTDTSTTPSIIIAATNPVPSSLAIGMLFNIKVKNTNLGPVSLQLNGNAGIAGKRTDGSQMVGGNLTASEEMMFVYNGVDFTSMVPPIPSVPPVTTFYVRPDGNDNNSGFANDPADAFLTISGAVYNIGARYISQSAITIRVADGTYNDAVECSGQYIASWNIVGNSANPGNCIINATSTSQATYPPHAGLASAFTCVNGAIASVTGFTFESYFWNVGSGQGSLVITNCNFTATTTGWAPIWADEGLIQMFGNCQYSGAAPIGCIFQALLAGYIKMGEYDVLGSTPLTFYIANGANITGETALASQNGTIQTCQAVTFTGVVPNCKQYSTMTGGGIMGPGVFPGTQPGTVALPGWIS